MVNLFNTDRVILSLKQNLVLLKENDWTLLDKFWLDSLVVAEMLYAVKVSVDH